jgi:signal transduction histidine kinase
LQDGRTHESVTSTPRGGAVRNYRLISTPIKNTDNEIVAAIEMVEDITQQQLAEKAMRNAKDSAEEASLVKSEFLANISHEIRTPLHGIIGMAEVLAATPLTDGQAESLDIIISASESLLNIVDDIMNFSDLDSGKLSLVNQAFDLENCLRMVTRQYQRLAAEKGVELKYDLARGLPAKVVGDEQKLTQILSHLCSNAVKYTASGRISIKLEKEEGGKDRRDLVGLHFTIKDTGVGIREKKLEKIFESFAQEHNPPARIYGGTGLGLAICAHLVKLMNGSFRVESKRDKGSTFEFTVFLARADRPAGKKKPSGNGRHQRVLKIVVAEDNPSSRKTLMKILSRLGHELLLAENEEDLLARVRDDQPDLLMMTAPDVNPGWGAVLKKLRRSGRKAGGSIPVVVLRAGNGSFNREQCLALGCQDCLEKPFRKEKVAVLLAKYW